jgi:hypothetical protein
MAPVRPHKQRRMGNRKSLPQHGKPEPALSLKPAEFTEKNLRRRFFFACDTFASLILLILRFKGTIPRDVIVCIYF